MFFRRVFFRAFFSVCLQCFFGEGLSFFKKIFGGEEGGRGLGLY